MEKLKMYTVIQIGLGSLLGGPLAAMYMLKKNFDVLGEKKLAQQTILWWSLFVVLLMCILPFLPEHFPNFIIPLAYIFTARSIAIKHQMTKKSIADAGKYRFQSNWKVFGLSCVALVVLLAVFVAWMFVLSKFGFYNFN